MHLIAEKADMVQSNVHYYYKTKQELLKGLQEWILEECYDMQQVSKKSSKDTLEDQNCNGEKRRVILIVYKQTAAGDCLYQGDIGLKKKNFY